MVRSIDRALDVLVMVGEAGEPLPLPAITARLKLPRTTAFNIVRTLVRRGALQTVGTQGYRLGPLVGTLAGSQASEQSLVARYRPVLEKIAALTAETVLLSVPAGDEIVFIDKVESSHVVRYSVAVGTRRPLYCSAHGKLVLAHMPERTLAAYLKRTPLQARTARTIVDAAHLRKELAAARRRGYSISDGEFVDDVFTLSVPLPLGPDGLPAAMISVVGPANRTKPARRAIAAVLQQCALEAVAART